MRSLLSGFISLTSIALKLIRDILTASVGSGIVYANQWTIYKSCQLDFKIEQNDRILSMDRHRQV